MRKIIIALIGVMLSMQMAFALGAGAEDRTISADYTLTADETVSGTLTVGEGVTLDLNGHVLRVSALAGSGNVVDSKNFQILDYVEANGAQRIVTDLVPNANTSVEAVATPMQRSSLTLFGTQTWEPYRYLYMFDNYRWYFFGKGTAIANNLALNVPYRVFAHGGKAMAVNATTGVLIGNISESFTNTDNTQLSICGLTASSNPQYGYFKVHSFKVWHQNVMRYDFVPARNPDTGAIGLLNRLDGMLATSNSGTEFLAGSAIGTMGIGALRIEAVSEAALSGFTGSVASNVRMAIDGNCTLSANADWSAFGSLAIDGTVRLAGHDLLVSNLVGTGTVTDCAYDMLEYVESSGAQIVKTGIVPSTSTGVSIDFTLLDSKQVAIFGCKTWGSERYLLILDKGRLVFFGAGNNIGSVSVGTRYKTTVTPGTSPNGTGRTVNVATGSQVGSATVDLTNSDGTELCLFDYSVDTYSKQASYRLYSFSMTQGGTQVRNLVPAKHHDTGKVGLLDTITGHFFTSGTATDLIAGPVVTEGSSGGRLRIAVAEGSAVTNSSVLISGDVELVKEGGGLFEARRHAQTYRGGTRVSAGTLQQLNIGGIEALFGSSACFMGAKGDNSVKGSDIVVDTGAVFDFHGAPDYRWYNIILNGGAIRNGGCDQGAQTSSLGTLTLTTNSVLECGYDTTFFDSNAIHVDMGGYTLYANMGENDIHFHNAGVVTNGTLSLNGSGYFRVYTGINARGARLYVNSALWLVADISVDDYYAAYSTDLNRGGNLINVYGRFTPATDYFYATVMQDGSVIDLNERSSALPTMSAFTTGPKTLTFASGATVTVDVHGRVPCHGKVIDWGAGNTPADVTFVIDAESKALGRALAVRDDGLYVTSGIVLIIR